MNAFEELEDARVRMEVAFMTKTGTPLELEKIIKQVEEIVENCKTGRCVCMTESTKHKVEFIQVKLVDNKPAIEIKGYRGCEGVIVCGSREMRAKRQVVEGVISQIKLFNAGSGWRTLTCVLVYTYAYAIGYSYYRRGELEV